jgi:glutamate/tyrosine decarboxylase-like PLP-dependent enzyme
VWAVLRTLGRQGVIDLITRTCRHAQTMAAYLSQAGLEVLNDVVLNQVLVRAATDDQTLALVAAVQRDGTCWCGPTVWQDRPAMRISISGWATTAQDIEQSADVIIAAAQRQVRRLSQRSGRPCPGRSCGELRPLCDKFAASCSRVLKGWADGRSGCC